MEPLVFERDRFLRAQLHQACRALPEGEAGGGIVAVVGAGHVDGIVRDWEQPVSEEELQRITAVPPETAAQAATRWIAAVTATAAVAAVGYATFCGVRGAIRIARSAL